MAVPCVYASSVTQFCLTLRHPMDRGPPGSSVHEILPARILEWVAVSCFRGSSRPKDRTHVSWVSCIDRQILYHWAPWKVLVIYISSVQSLSRVRLFENPWIAARQASLSITNSYIAASKLPSNSQRNQDLHLQWVSSASSVSHLKLKSSL